MQSPQTKHNVAGTVLDRDLPAGGAWASAIRADALKRLTEMGLPQRRDEYWRWTRPEALTSRDPMPAVLLHTEEAPEFDAIDRLRVVFVDGIFDADASDPLDGSGLVIERLADAAKLDVHWAKTGFGQLEAAGQSPVSRPLAALNTAHAADGILIHATSKVSRPVNLIYVRKTEASDAMLHHYFKIDAGADLTVLENGAAAGRLNTVMEVDLAEGGAFHHVRAQGRDHERVAATHIFARLAQEAVFKSFTMTANGALTRNECVIDINGDEAVAHVAGAAPGAIQPKKPGWELRRG